MKNHWVEIGKRRREYSKYLVCLFKNESGIPVYYGCQVLAPNVIWNIESKSGGFSTMTNVIPVGKYHGFAIFYRAGFLGLNASISNVPLYVEHFLYSLEFNDGDKFTAKFSFNIP